ncbi:DUF6538 domain-containing protein [Celeribacter sp.]|uniref:DUF6538 domain-containing protein n=1 Tax=Celeribacter sp. TaxID=1890673 RepID=UPI003A8D264C
MPRNRSFPPHLEIRRASYYWRRRLPRFLRDEKNSPPPKKVFLCFSLRTQILRDAKILARRLTEMSDLIFAADAETVMAISPDIQVTMLESLARFEIEAFERARAVAAPRSPEAAALDLRREEALQTTLRQALYLGDREVARRPLRHVAMHLGIDVNEGDEDWSALAYEATKVLLDVSHERARRQQGIYEQPTLFFRRAVNDTQTAPPRFRSTSGGNTIEPTAFASAQAIAKPPAPAPASFASKTDAITSKASPEVHAPVEPAPRHDPIGADEPSDCVSSHKYSTCVTPAIIPAGFDLPEGYDEQTWQQARVAARPPRILVDRKLLSDTSRAALEKQRGITVVEAFELYFELRSWGYKAPFNKHQKRKPIPERLKAAPVDDRLCEDLKGKHRLALDFWPAVLGDIPVDEVHVDDVNDALEYLRRLPANHSKSGKDRNRYNVVEIIEKADADQAQLEKDIAAAQANGTCSELIDKMRMNRKEDRISVTTFIKHGRVARAVGEMLMDMQLIDQNPFSICSWSNKDEKELKSTEGERKREAWDDRINALWGSRIFHEPLDDIGEPLFWAPLIARHQGMRMEEILQLGPEDFGSDNGIPYLRIQHTIINGVKTLSSARTLPIHPQLIDLGLLKLVALRKKQGHIRLFPFINRSKQKGRFSANFSKAFAYYRRNNECYWPGLDFHALRTTFHHDLLADDKSDAIRCRLMGHTYTDEGDRSYGQNLGIETLAKRIKSVVVDISMIRRPFEDHHMAPGHTEPQRHLRVVG